MLVYRDHKKNVDPAQWEKLAYGLEGHLNLLDANWPMGAVGWAAYGAHFTKLGDTPSRETMGNELCLRYWAWGDNDEEAFSSLERLYSNLGQALNNLVGELQL
jgi:hypothetical protein